MVGQRLKRKEKVKGLLLMMLLIMLMREKKKGLVTCDGGDVVVVEVKVGHPPPGFRDASLGVHEHVALYPRPITQQDGDKVKKKMNPDRNFVLFLFDERSGLRLVGEVGNDRE